MATTAENNNNRRARMAHELTLDPLSCRTLTMKWRDVNRALMEAAADGLHPDHIHRLINQGADPNACGRDGVTALHRAAENGHESVVKALLEAGADCECITGAGQTAAHYAACGGHVLCLHELIDALADVAMSDSSGQTPKDLAATLGHKGVVDVLNHHEDGDGAALMMERRRQKEIAQQMQGRKYQQILWGHDIEPNEGKGMEFSQKRLSAEAMNGVRVGVFARSIASSAILHALANTK